MEITLDGDIRRVSKLLIDGIDSKEATNVVYSSLDKERPSHSITYKHPNTILEMAKQGLLIVTEIHQHFQPVSTTSIQEFPYYNVSFSLSRLKNAQIVYKDEILTWKNIKVNTSQGTFQYGNSEPTEIEIGYSKFKFLICLMRSRKIVSYAELSKYLEMSSPHKGYSSDVARDLTFILRDLKEALCELGVPADLVDSMFVNKKKEGYKLASEL